MSKKFFDSSFDPYQALVDLDARINALHRAHNALARDYEQTQKDFDVLLKSHQHLQQAHLELSQLVLGTILDKDSK